MSHFSVAIITTKGGKTVEELLAPYQENNMDDCPRAYLEFKEFDEENYKNLEKEYEDNMDKYDNIEQLIEYYGYTKNEDTGKYGYWHNPNSKWDWYSIGGRWSDYLVTKDGIECNHTKIKDLDWDKMINKRKEEAEGYWYNLSKERIKNTTKEKFIEEYSRVHTYAVVTSDGKWYSKGDMWWFGHSIEEDGAEDIWHKNFYKRFIESADEDSTITIVDCHI